VPESDNWRKHELECMRLAADCMQWRATYITRLYGRFFFGSRGYGPTWWIGDRARIPGVSLCSRTGNRTKPSYPVHARISHADPQATTCELEIICFLRTWARECSISACADMSLAVRGFLTSCVALLNRPEPQLTGSISPPGACAVGAGFTDHDLWSVLPAGAFCSGAAAAADPGARPGLAQMQSRLPPQAWRRTPVIIKNILHIVSQLFSMIFVSRPPTGGISRVLNRGNGVGSLSVQRSSG
jgi:hypothetical protein